MKYRGHWKAKAFAAALAAVALVAPATGAEPLRVCADPDNLPFSKSEGPQRGMYIDLAELVGKQLGRPVEYVWYATHYQRRALRNTILQDGCDAVFALPADADYKVRGLQRSKPFMAVSYAIVAAPGYAFKSLDDLKKRHLAVQFSSTPHILLSQHEGFRSTTFRSAEEALAALAKGEVDAAFLWGPVAGYENKLRWGSRWQVTPVAGHDLAGAVAVAVRSGKDALAAEIDRALAELAPQIRVLAAQYGFPLEAPVQLGRNSASLSPVLASSSALNLPAAWVVRVADNTVASTTPKADAKPAVKPAAKPGAKPDAKAATSGATSAVTPAVPAAVLSPVAQAGRVAFNDKCSHCHGTDGFSPVRERDVRYLKARYSDKWIENATTTVRNGRPDAGMPTWKDILKDGELDQLMSFLGTIQK